MKDDRDAIGRDIREFPCEISHIYKYCDMKGLNRDFPDGLLFMGSKGSMG
jgi:hypothetical protein